MGSTAIGIQTVEGVCLAVEKRITSPLMEPSSIEKIVEIDTHIGMSSDEGNTWEEENKVSFKKLILRQFISQHRLCHEWFDS